MSGTALPGTPPVGTESARLSNGNTITISFNGAVDAYCLAATNPAGTTNGWFYVSSLGGLQPNGTNACGSF